MPPLRTMPMAKPIKTERTHEENQERAYIAASRRSDRSLEARVESARRASEIHKRRTGRSLRVTEQDVVNEEMYEEEDDDLPMQYRRLTAHLQTSNADFDRRLAAYLTNHVAMRTALGQAVNSQNQGYPNATQFAGQRSPSQSQSAFTQQNSMAPPQNRSPATYRQSPYPVNHQGMKQGTHKRAASIASTNDLKNFPSPFNQQSMNSAAAEARRNSLSLPAHSVPSTPSGQPANKRQKSIHNLKLENLPSNNMSMLSPPKSESGESKTSSPHAQQLKPSQFPTAFDMSTMNPMSAGSGSMPFSTTLPMESQQLLGGAFDNSDAMTAMLMGPNFNPMQPLYNYDNGKGKSEFSQNSSFDGMHQTLAPGFLDTSVRSYDMHSEPNSAFANASPFTTSAGGYGMPYDSTFGDPFKGNAYGSGLNSGEATPNGDWQNFINDGNAWEEQPSQLTNS